MLSTTKFALAFALSLAAGSVALAPDAQEPPTAGWFGKCLRCEWDPWGGPAYCAVTTSGGFYGCLAQGYKCSVGGSPCGKKPVAGYTASSTGDVTNAP